MLWKPSCQRCSIVRPKHCPWPSRVSSSVPSPGSRRADDEEEVESMAEDDAAVSPVIATILMVAITGCCPVSSTCISSLAETDVKGVPRHRYRRRQRSADEGHWRITVEQRPPLATQAAEEGVLHQRHGAQHLLGELADSAGVYGFNPANSDAFVTFVDSVTRNKSLNGDPV